MSKETTTTKVLLRNLTAEQKEKIVFLAECFITEFNIEAYRSFLIHYSWQQVEAKEIPSIVPFEVHDQFLLFQKTLREIVTPSV